MALKSFGTYSFTASHIVQQSYNDNFGDVIIRTTRFPGMEGGYSDQGSAKSPSEIGIIWFGFTMEATSRASMQAHRNLINKMKKSGLQKITKTWYDGTEVYTYGFVNHIEMKENLASNTDLFQPVEIIFTVPYPFWLTDGNANFWDINLDWDTGENWGPSSDVINAAGLTTQDTITITSDLAVPAMLVVEIPSGEAALNLSIERSDALLTVYDKVSYAGELESLDNLVIDPRTPQVLLNGGNGYTAAFSALYPRWITLEPGANLITVRMGRTTDEANVYIIYQGEY